jgi:two-component SAPR family response regulator
LRTSLTYIRKALYDVGFKDMVWHTNGRYFIDTKNILTDLDCFEEIMSQIKSNHANIGLLGKSLCEVYKGAFCEDIDIYEFNLEKEKYDYKFQKAMLLTIKYFEERKDYKEAINFMNTLIQHQKHNESYYNKKAELYQLMGNESMVRQTKEEIACLKEK